MKTLRTIALIVGSICILSSCSVHEKCPAYGKAKTETAKIPS